MTEIPPHLLERSRARRAALGLGDGEGAAPVPATTASAAPAKAASSAPASAPKAAPVAVVKPERVLPPYVAAELARKKIPMWAVPVLLLLPIWGFLYVGTLERGPQEATGVLAVGSEAYAGKCAGCHGAAGGGGTGPAMSGGAVLATFPQWQDHVNWVTHGSAGVKGQPYGATGKIANGNMPAFGGTTTAQELLAIVYYERVAFGGAAEADLAVLHAMAMDETITSEQLEASFTVADLDALAAELGIDETTAAAAGGSGG